LKKSIVSVSRRTDIPAFFGDWFVQQLEKGHTTVYHPYKHKRITVSLEPQDVAAFVFWSKDYRPFWNYLDVFDRRGYSFVFHYTITGLPSIFEPKVPSAEKSCQTLKLISQRYSPQHITWRYDPIILTDLTPPDYHIDKFRDLCKQLVASSGRKVPPLAKVPGPTRLLSNTSEWDNMSLYAVRVAHILTIKCCRMNNSVK
jgi:hypothetical protein